MIGPVVRFMSGQIIGSNNQEENYRQRLLPKVESPRSEETDRGQTRCKEHPESGDSKRKGREYQLLLPAQVVTFFQFRRLSIIASFISVNDHAVEAPVGVCINQRKDVPHGFSIARGTQLHQTPWLAEIKELAEEGF